MNEILLNVGGFSAVATILILIFKNNHQVIMRLIKNHDETMKNLTEVISDMNKNLMIHDATVKNYIETCREREANGYSDQ